MQDHQLRELVQLEVLVGEEEASAKPGESVERWISLRIQSIELLHGYHTLRNGKLARGLFELAGERVRGNILLHTSTQAFVLFGSGSSQERVLGFKF